MQIIKPQALSVLHQPFTLAEHHLCITTLLMFRFGDLALAHEATLWQLTTEELPDGIVDEARPKPAAELLVDGYGYPADGPKPACQVRAALGSVDKSLRIIGDRHWRLDGTASDAKPFERIRADWAHAFGGEAIADNHLPNVRRAGEQLRSKADTLTPAGLTARGFDHPERLRYAGTYDEQWQKTRAPYPPEDYDMHGHMLAEQDQWLDAFPKGDEPFVIEHMHATKPLIESQLPALVARCFVSRCADGSALEEIPMHIDTVRLIPHRERGVLSFRGMAPTTQDDADDIKLVMLACERIGQRRDLAHYEAEAQLRLDSARGIQACLNDAPLLPQGMAPPEPTTLAPAPPGILAQRIEHGAQLELDAARQRLIEQGVDVDALNIPKTIGASAENANPPAEPIDATDMEEQFVALKKQAEQALADAETAARQLCADSGVDYDDAKRDARQGEGRPPTFSAKDTLAALQAQLTLSQNAGVALDSVTALLNDPAGVQAQLIMAERQLVDTYRQFAHLGSPPTPKPNEPAQRRDAFERAVRDGQPLHGRDFTCADLRGLDLSSADLSGAFLAGAQLQDANLTGANLNDTVLAFAQLTDATLRGASMHRTNLGGASLDSTDCSHCAIDGAALDNANFTGAKLHHAKLTDVTLDGAVLTQADFTGAKLDSCRAHAAHWQGGNFTGASIHQAMVLGFDAPGATLQRATLTRSSFTDTNLTAANLTEATIDGCAFAGSATLTDANFNKSTLSNISLANAQLQGATFNEATLNNVDFTKAHLAGASLYRTRATNTLWRRANLRGATLVSLQAPMAIFQRAQLQGADLSGAMLHGADFTRAAIDDETCFTDAVTTRAQLSWAHEDSAAGASS